jgi:hypothetical protein
MAGQVPSFVTGAKALVKITTGFGDAATDTVLAFCSDVNYSVNVQHIPIESLGIFQVITHEPVSYVIEGSFNVVRYATKIEEALVTNFRDLTGVEKTEAEFANDAQAAGVADHINPAKLIESSSFDLKIQEREKEIVEGEAKRSTFFTIFDCRVTSRRSSLNKRNVLVDSYSFVGRLAQDGTLEAGSG